LTLRHYENFFVLGPLTPVRLIPHLSALYAFCRYSDDLADEIGDRDEAAGRLSEWEEELRRSLAGEAMHPITRALAKSVAQFRLPAEPLFDLLSAFRQDLSVTQFPTFEYLRNYTRRSADPVGRLVLRLYGYDQPELDALSDSICTGLQLANFCQDIGDDSRRGRIYIPLDECVQFDVDPDEILSLNPSVKLEKLLRFQIVRAYKFLQAGASLPEKVDGNLRISVRLFLAGGMRLLANVQKDPLAVLRRRVRLNPWQKLATLRVALRQGKTGDLVMSSRNG
jgi:squalene synthase HpnC